jgi:hypothetical protein
MSAMVACAALSLAAAQVAAQQPDQSAAEALVKVDVVLTRVAPTAESDPRLEEARRSLERTEVLFTRGLVTQAQLEKARAQAQVLQAENATTSRLPYSLLVAIGGQATRLRVDVSVPYGTSTRVLDGGIKSTERQYHPTGTSIDCGATRLPDGRYRLQLSVSDTSIVSSERVDAAAGTTTGVAFRTLSVANTLYLRDGQTLPFSVGTDRITGETLRAEVTLTVLK